MIWDILITLSINASLILQSIFALLAATRPEAERKQAFSYTIVVTIICFVLSSILVFLNLFPLFAMNEKFIAFYDNVIHVTSGFGYFWQEKYIYSEIPNIGISFFFQSKEVLKWMN